MAASTRTLIQLIDLTARFINPDLVFDGTFESSGNSTTFGVDDDLKIYPSDRFNGAWVYIDGGSPTIRNQPITQFDGPAGKVNWRAALGAAPDSLAFMILPRNRDELVERLHDMRMTLAESGHMVRQREQYMIAGTPIANPDFSMHDSAGLNLGWDTSGSFTISAPDEGSPPFLARDLSFSAVGTGSVAQGSPWLSNVLRNHTVQLHWPVRVGTSDTLRASILGDSTALASKDSSGPSTDWEILTTDPIKIDANEARDLTVKLETVSTLGGAASFGMPWISGGPMLQEYSIPVGGIQRVTRVERSSAILSENLEDWRKPLSNWIDVPFSFVPIRYGEWLTASSTGTDVMSILRLLQAVPNGSVLRLTVEFIEQGLSTSPADTEVQSMTESEAYFLAAHTAVALLEEDMPRLHPDSRARVATRIGNLNTLIRDLSKGLHDYSKSATTQPMVM